MKKALLLFAAIFVLASCSNDNDDPCAEIKPVGGFLIDLAFPVSRDIELGLQVSNQISSSGDFNVLPRTGNEQAYAYLESIQQEILNSGKLTYKDDFAWELNIIDEDVLNAFATPGGYIYVYTGLIKFLDNVDDLAGVMGHELAHADRRHSTNQLIKKYQVSILSSILGGSGENGSLAQIVTDIAGQGVALKFSRDDENDADANSVEYLGNTDFACNGAARFFEKLNEGGQGGGTPEFLSTHPSPDNRVSDINARAVCNSCNTANTTKTIEGLTYNQFKALF